MSKWIALVDMFCRSIWNHTNIKPPDPSDCIKCELKADFASHTTSSCQTYPTHSFMMIPSQSIPRSRKGNLHLTSMFPGLIWRSSPLPDTGPVFFQSGWGWLVVEEGKDIYLRTIVWLLSVKVLSGLLFFHHFVLECWLGGGLDGGRGWFKTAYLTYSHCPVYVCEMQLTTSQECYWLFEGVSCRFISYLA